jgi:hypothetical protein
MVLEKVSGATMLESMHDAASAAAAGRVLAELHGQLDKVSAPDGICCTVTYIPATSSSARRARF